jgi:HD superfamily phosphodiesterase
LTDLVRGAVSRVNAGAEIVARMRDVLQTEDAEQRAELKALGEIAHQQAIRTEGNHRRGLALVDSESGDLELAIAEFRFGSTDGGVSIWRAQSPTK